MTVGVGEIVRVVFEYVLPSLQIAQNVRHYVNDTGTSVTDNTVLDDMELLFGQVAFEWAPLAAASTLASIVRVSVFQGGRFIPVGSRAIGIIGSQPDTILAHGVAAVGRAVVAGSTGQARIFLPGIAENVSSEGLLDAASVVRVLGIMAILANTWDSSQNPGVSGVFGPVTAKFPAGTFLRLTGTVLANNIEGYQRRRKPGVGI